MYTYSSLFPKPSHLNPTLLLYPPYIYLTHPNTPLSLSPYTLSHLPTLSLSYTYLIINLFSLPLILPSPYSLFHTHSPSLSIPSLSHTQPSLLLSPLSTHSHLYTLCSLSHPTHSLLLTNPHPIPIKYTITLSPYIFNPNHTLLLLLIPYLSIILPILLPIIITLTSLLIYSLLSTLLSSYNHIYLYNPTPFYPILPHILHTSFLYLPCIILSSILF
jgi:hypothetical protein